MFASRAMASPNVSAKIVFPDSNITRKDKERRAVTKEINDFNFLSMMLLAPGHKTLGIEQKAGFLQKPLLHVVETHKRREPPCGAGVWVLANLFEDAYFAVDHENGWNVWRFNPHPPEK